MSRPLRILLILTIALTLLLATGVGAVAILLGSEWGTRFAAGQVKKLAGDGLTWSALEGTLLGPLRLQDLQLTMEGLDLSVAALELSWQPAALLRGRATVEALSVSGVRLATESGPEEQTSSPFNPEDLRLPVAVDLNAITIRDLEITADGADPLVIDRIDLAARLDGSELELQGLTVRLPQGGLSLNANTVLSADMPVDMAASWDWLLAPPGDAAANTPLPASLESSFALDGKLHWGERLTFNLDYQGEASGLEALDVSLPPQARFAGNATGSQDAESLLLQALSLAVADTPLALSLTGQVTGLSDPEPMADLDLRWEGLNWPLQAAEPVFTSPGGRASLAGTASSYSADLAANLNGQDIPEGRWTLVGRGNTSGFRVEGLDAEIIGGELSASGEITWDPAITWNLEISGSGLQPGQLQPDLTGVLALTLQTDGQLDPEGNPLADLRLKELRGSLANFPLQADAHARLSGDVVELVSGNVQSEGNILAASGTVEGEVLDLAWEMHAPNIAGLLEGADGEISASGSITGTTGQPRVQALLGGENLRLDNYRIAALKATVVAGLAPADPLDLDLDLDQLADGETRLLAALQVKATGTTGKHRLSARLDSGEARLRATLDGGADAELPAWQGRISELGVNTTDFGQWALEGAPALSLASDRASLGEGCMKVASGPGRVCAAGDWIGDGDSAANLQLQDLPLEMFVPAVSSAINGRLGAKLSAGGALEADGAITLGEGKVRVDDARSLAHGGGQLSLRVDTRGLLAEVQLATPEEGSLEAVATLPALSTVPLAEAQPLAGTIKAELPDLSGLAAWVPELERSAGRLGADLKLGGTLDAPRVEGTLALQDAGATVPLAGLDLQGIQLLVASEPTRPGKLSLTGAARSGPGEVKLEGQADLDDSSLALTLTGDRFEIYDTADARALLSPDLQIAWKDNILKLRGQVTVPQADITPKIKLSPTAQGDGSANVGTPGEAIVPSSDVVVISETIEIAEQAEVPTAPFRIDSQLRLQMGEKVRVKAVGFISRITGAVDFTNTPEQEALIPIANGRFSLQEGTFRAFGQDLEIETGHVIFDNVPATEPELNLRAVRWIDNDPQVTAAGVMVTGPLDQPVLELFSRPQLEASEIQSYLLTGRSPRSRDSVLGIGTYVTRKIYVGYGFNMLERTSEFNSLFNISPRYGVGSSVGEADNNINLTITYEH